MCQIDSIMINITCNLLNLQILQLGFKFPEYAFSVHINVTYMLVWICWIECILPILYIYSRMHGELDLEMHGNVHSKTNRKPNKIAECMDNWTWKCMKFLKYGKSGNESNLQKSRVPEFQNAKWTWTETKIPECQHLIMQNENRQWTVIQKSGNSKQSNWSRNSKIPNHAIQK